jgi:hypothetical protein
MPLVTGCEGVLAGRSDWTSRGSSSAAASPLSQAEPLQATQWLPGRQHSHPGCCYSCHGAAGVGALWPGLSTWLARPWRGTLACPLPPRMESGGRRAAGSPLARWRRGAGAAARLVAAAHVTQVGAGGGARGAGAVGDAGGVWDWCRASCSGSHAISQLFASCLFGLVGIQLRRLGMPRLLSDSCSLLSSLLVCPLPSGVYSRCTCECARRPSLAQHAVPAASCRWRRRPAGD